MHEVGKKDAEDSAEVVDEIKVQVLLIILHSVPHRGERGGD